MGIGNPEQRLTCTKAQKKNMDQTKTRGVQGSTPDWDAVKTWGKE